MFDLTISIVTQNNKQQLRQCLSSLLNFQQGLSMEIYIVDNDSNDGTKPMVLNDYKETRLIIVKEHASFARNHNRILKIAKGRYVVILNDDTVISKDCFRKLINYLRENPAIGAIGPKVRYADGRYQHSAFKFSNLSDLFADYFLNKIMPNNRLSALYKDIELVDKPKEVDWLLGACVAIPRNIIEKVGYLDEAFYLAYKEDADFCMRIKNAGYKIVYYPEAEIIHYGAQTTQRQALFMKKTLCKNRLKFFKKHRGYIYYLLSLFVLYLATLCNITFDMFRFFLLRINKDELLSNINEYIYITILL